MAKQKPRARRTKATPPTPRLPIPPPRPRVPIPPKLNLPSAPAPTPAPRARERGEKLIARLLDLHRKVDTDFYEIGRVLTELSRPDVYKPLGFATFDELLKKRDLPKRDQAYRLLAITRELDVDTARRLGISRAYNAIAYAKLFHPTQPVAAVVRRDPTLSVDRTSYKLSTIPIRLLRQIIRDKTNDLAPPPPAALQSTARSLAQLLHHAGLESVQVTSRPNGSKSYLTIRLPLTEAQKLAARLR